MDEMSFHREVNPRRYSVPASMHNWHGRRQIVATLNEAIRIMAEIGEMIGFLGGWPDAVKTDE